MQQGGGLPAESMAILKDGARYEPDAQNTERVGSPPYVWVQLWRGKAEATTVVPELLPVEWHFLECIVFCASRLTAPCLLNLY